MFTIFAAIIKAYFPLWNA